LAHEINLLPVEDVGHCTIGAGGLFEGGRLVGPRQDHPRRSGVLGVRPEHMSLADRCLGASTRLGLVTRGRTRLTVTLPAEVAARTLANGLQLWVTWPMRAKLPELRARLGRARLQAARGERQQARDTLTPIYGWFSEGLEARDLNGRPVVAGRLGVSWNSALGTTHTLSQSALSIASRSFTAPILKVEPAHTRGIRAAFEQMMVPPTRSASPLKSGYFAVIVRCVRSICFRSAEMKNSDGPERAVSLR
jgi:hypothetical protein